MSRRLFSIAGCATLVLALTASVVAQTTATTPPPQETQVTTTTTTQQTTAVQNADGTWTVIEYPVDKEVTVELTPGATLAGATGLAKIKRAADHTMINLNLTGLTTPGPLNLYAVDSLGKVSLLGPVTVTNGTAVQSFHTPLDKFMLVLSPEPALTTVATTTPVFFRSAVPQGFAVVPLATSAPEDGAAVGETVAAVTTPGTTSPYSVPMLNVPGMERGEDSQVKVNLTGALTGARVNINVEPRKDGPTMITARFHELKEAPAGKVFVLWAVGADNKFVKLGQIVNTGERNEAEIKSETALADFGLLITLEAPEAATPAGVVVGTIIR
ncbi:MAG TPA: hypothetical protein VFX96_03750 [Pyrinomonadaceae bacterium]|nr:hypothetical protein [Pyrinomonadaceae bacterium]